MEEILHKSEITKTTSKYKRKLNIQKIGKKIIIMKINIMKQKRKKQKISVK